MENFTTVFEKMKIQINLCMNEIIIPDGKDRPEIIAEAHGSAVGGHKGVSKTCARLKQRYQWEGMKKEVRDHIRMCTSCQKRKILRMKTKQPMIITDTSIDAFDKVALDIVGPLPKTKADNIYILTMQDDLTKYCMAAPLKEASAAQVANALAKHLISFHGAPRVILTDQGANFMSSLIKSLAKCFRIKQLRTTAYHPQSNGALERSHRVLADYLRHFTTVEQDWDEWINYAMFSYNTSRHESTQFTPFELLYGRVARAPSAFSYKNMKTYHNHVEALITKLQNVRYLARDNLIKAKERSKQYYDKKINIQEFKIGSWAFLLKENRKGKLDDHYLGPYQVRQVLANGNIKIQIKTNQTKVVHPNRLKIAYVPEGYAGL